jgi:hypothetical protein
MRDKPSTREAKQPRHSVTLKPKQTSADFIRFIRVLRAKLPLHLHQSWVKMAKVDPKPARKRRLWSLRSMRDESLASQSRRTIAWL